MNINTSHLIVLQKVWEAMCENTSMLVLMPYHCNLLDPSAVLILVFTEMLLFKNQQEKLNWLKLSP